MIKKIIKLFKDKKKTKRNKNKKIEKKNAEIINFINKAKNKNKIQTDQMEKKRLDALAKELVDSYRKAAQKSFLSMPYCLYLFVFRALQSMIINSSFPIYRHYLRSATKQIVEDHKQWLHEFKEWDEAPSEAKLIGEKKQDNKNDTLH